MRVCAPSVGEVVGPGSAFVALAIVMLLSSCGRRDSTPHTGTGRQDPQASVDSGTLATADSVSADSTSVEAAVDVVLDYYAAIAAGDYRRAYEHWAREGAASGQTFDEFATGFSGTASVVAEIGTPGRLDAAAGSRYVEVPVTVRAVTRIGEEQQFTGRYVLRRSVVDGATPAQRRWHFDSGSLK